MSRSPSEHADDKQQTQQQNTPDNHTLEKNEHKRENVVEAFMRNFDEDFAYWTRRANEGKVDRHPDRGYFLVSRVRKSPEADVPL